MISDVPRDQLGPIWGVVGPMLEQALQHGQGDGMDVRAVLGELMQGRRSLWVIHEGTPEDGNLEIRAAVVAALEPVPGVGHKLMVDLLAGEGLREWAQELMGYLHQAAELSGAFTVEASCRRGLATFLQKELGWKVKAVIMEYRL